MIEKSSKVSFLYVELLDLNSYINIFTRKNKL